MRKYLLDTNILIYYWNGDIPEGERDKIEEILKHSFIISIITKIERFFAVLSGYGVRFNNLIS